MKKYIAAALMFSCGMAVSSDTGRFFTGNALAQEQKSPAARATPVVVAAAYKDNFVDKVEAIGTLRANESITLTSTVTETVTAVNFTDGQRVQKGDILVEMTSGEEKALLDQQKALTNEASKQLERARGLAKSGAVSSAVLDERQREYTSAKAGLAALQSRLEDYIIVAPFDGVVGLRNLSVGALLQPSSVITTLDDDTVMKLDFSVPSIFLPTLQTGTSIKATAAGFNEEFNGEVAAINSQVDEVTRSVAVRAIIPNPDAKLKPGLLMTVELARNPREAVAISESAIIPEGRKHFVLVLDESQNPPVVEKREVVIGTRRQGDVEITQNIKEGDKVVVQGTMMAKPGAPVTVTAEQKRGETPEQLFKRLREEKSQGGDKKGGDK
ncbi:MAG: efflux transporter periplasmic adaptor subunit [Micavibrio aeruginosavorus]|uniref:Efflux transporter periplasmic adaptor subunit n=1 Tax=Micavibrio aeruginosavorus TaxID=349221 RepID=A0A2W4ZZL6_9BACT|nr:MAG: efflux transporter periplasmic adaptor subunit [Micavibrio aeruginosavorus]